MILMIGTQEILIILVVVLLLFGAKKIPGLMKEAGKGVKEVNKAKNQIKKDLNIEESEVVKDIKTIKKIIK